MLANCALKLANPRGAEPEAVEGIMPPKVFGEDPAILESRLLNQVS